MPSSNNLQVVEPEDERDEEDVLAEQQLIEAFASTRKREKVEVACVEIPRYPNVPKRDGNGRLVRDGEQKLISAALELYFRRLEPGTFSDLRAKHTHPAPVRRRGRTEYEEKTDEEAFALEIAYVALMPWCRTRYFDDHHLWGDDPCGTGMEFMRIRLSPGELSYCLDAVLQLEGLGEERSEQLGKS